MAKVKKFPSLRQVILRLILFRLFLPLLILGLIVTAGVGYLGEKNLENQQNKLTQSMVNTVDYYLDHGGRILDAVARVAENSEIENLSIFMNNTREAYRYFDTLYYLDEGNKIRLLVPSDPRYSNLDMSRLPDFQKKEQEKSPIISRPFISLRTGDPTVYLVRPLSIGGCVVGELNLALFQQEIMKITSMAGEDFVFIMDQAGTLLAHPSSELVKQQTNLSNLEIFHRAMAGKDNAIYLYNGKRVLGSAARVERTGWIVVDQVLLSVFWGSYAWTLGLILLALMAIWLTLGWSLRKQLQRYVIAPLEQFSRGTNALTVGDFSQVNSLPSISTAFTELNKLAVDFQFMGNSLQVRETALRESEDRYRGLFDRVPIGLFRATLTGEILEINQNAAYILGYPHGESLLKFNIADIIYLSLTDQYQSMDQRDWNLSNFETQIQRHDGKIIWVQINSHVVYDDKALEKYCEGSIEDITERKRIENMIKQQQGLLLKAEKEQRKALEEALVMKDEFISLISHEFKTPLNVIYSAIQLIEGVYLDQIPERVKKLIGNIRQNTFRQLRLANNLLDITRLNSGQCKLNMKNIDIVFLTKMITESVEVYANQKNIELSFKSNIEYKNISIDDEKYERIILNLLSNAVKFTENRGKITVTLHGMEKLDRVQIIIKDTGIGIPQDKKGLIFKRFGQVDSNLSRRAEGTGIGLSLVKLLVNILGGTIEVESELGVGSIFSITLPVKEVDMENEWQECLNADNRLISETNIQFSDIYF